MKILKLSVYNPACYYIHLIELTQSDDDFSFRMQITVRRLFGARVFKQPES